MSKKGRVKWLDDNQNKELADIINDTIPHEIESRHWGTKGIGKSPSNVPRFFISDIRGLFLATGAIRYILSKKADVYYRGQNQDWKLCPSLYRGLSPTKQSGDIEAADKKNDQILKVIEKKFHLDRPVEEREALAQHYGLRTRCLDAVDNIQTAAWFAYCRAEPANPVDETSCSSLDDVGFIQLLGAPRDSDEWEAIDLRRLSSEFLRPHAQQAFSIRAKGKLDRHNFFSALNIGNFIVPKYLLRVWSHYDFLSPEIMFPTIQQDRGFAYWMECEKILRKNKLIDYSTTDFVNDLYAHHNG